MSPIIAVFRGISATHTNLTGVEHGKAGLSLDLFVSTDTAVQFVALFVCLRNFDRV